MKRLLFILWAILVGLQAMAQELQVFSIVGQAEREQQGQWTPLVKGEMLKESTRVRTSRQGSLTLLDPSRRKVYAVQSEQGGEAGKLVAAQRAKAKSMTEEAFTALAKSMFGQQDGRYHTRSGVTYRGDSPEEQLAAWLESNITPRCEVRASDYPIALQTLNPATHLPTRTVKVGESLEIWAVNESNMPLWVALVDIDATGEWSAVSPQCELVTPHATVALRWPVEFLEPRGMDHLLLVVYTEPFDVAQVVQLRGVASPSGTVSALAGAAVVGVVIE